MSESAFPDLAACPVCGSRRGKRELATPRIAVVRCTGCGHAVARHSQAASKGSEYHTQYEQGAFVESLRATRVRQARVIASLIRRHHPRAAGVLDFGCGRGWFLQTAREEGFHRVAGLDSSVLAVELLRRSGIEALLAPPDPLGQLALERLSFRPDVLTMLDVVEHFSSETLFPSLARLVDALRPELGLVVVKVPVRGILYRAAASLKLLSVVGPIEQLYQVGTEPPHHSYFSRRSGELLLSRCGLELLEVRADRDFEPATLSARARALQSSPRLAQVMGAAVAFGADTLRLQDSLIFVARAGAAPRR